MPHPPTRIHSLPTRRHVALAAAWPLLHACSSSPEAATSATHETALLQISIEADADMNADIKGRGAPLMLRIYELKSEVVFEDADFFSLQDKDRTTLGADLLAVDQFFLRPGESRSIRRKANAETTAIGIFAAYRELPQAVWRLVHRLPPPVEKHWYRALAAAPQTRLELRLHERALQLTDAGATPVATPRRAKESAPHAMPEKPAPQAPVKTEPLPQGRP